MLFAFGDFFGTMRIEQSARGDHMTRQSIFIDANVRTHRFLYFDHRWRLLLKRENVMKFDEKCDFDGVFELQWTIKNFIWVE